MSHFNRFLIAAALVASAVLVTSVVPAISASASPSKGRLRALGATVSEIVVKYRDASAGRYARTAVDAKLVQRHPQEAIEVIDPAGALDVAIAELEADPNVVYAEPNYVYEASGTTPNDSHFGYQWGLNKISMPEAWTVGSGSHTVTVAVVDSGIALRHPDLAPNIWTNPGESGGGKESNGIDDDGNGYVDDLRGWDLIDNDNRPGDAHGHGSHVAGTIGARGNDSYGAAGINWDVSLVPLRALDHRGSGTSIEIAAAFHYAGRAGVDVVNASLGGTGESRSILEAVTAYPETLFVVAAGNDGWSNDATPQYPCNYQIANLVCVAASDSNDNLASFSNYGAASVDLVAPGVGIFSTAPSLATVFSETFETDIADRWSTGGTNNLWGRSFDSQGGYLADSPGIDYLSETDSWAATRVPFSLAGQEDCRLAYEIHLETEGGKDSLTIEASRDGAAWSKVAGWTGNSNGTWRTMSENLQAFDGAHDVYLRFRLRSDTTWNEEGADIDNVKVRCQSTSFSGSEFRSASGTSMAAPHVAGVAALLKASSPSSTVAQIVAALLSGTETVPGLAGKVVTSGRLSATGALEALTGRTIQETAAALPVIDQPRSEPPATEEPVDAPSVDTTRERTITLRLIRSLRAQGRVITDHAACAVRVPVVIKRNGMTIASTMTDTEGFYRIRLDDRPGRYLVKAPRAETSELPPVVCAAARSGIAKN